MYLIQKTKLSVQATVMDLMEGIKYQCKLRIKLPVQDVGMYLKKRAKLSVRVTEMYLIQKLKVSVQVTVMYMMEGQEC
jgi:hypothetical protein